MERLTYMDGGKWRMRIGDTEYSGKEVDRISAYEDILCGDDLDFDTTRPRPDFVFRAEKELQKAVNDLEQSARRGAPQADIFNLQRKVEYKQYVLGLLKGM